MNDNQHIPSGYKPSPLGPIPEDWEVKRLGEVAEMTSGTTPSRANIDFYSNGSIPWVKTTDLNNGILNSTEESVTNKALEKTSLKMLPQGTVLVAMYGGFNQIGRTAMLGIEATINQALSALICNEQIYNTYLLSWLNCRVKEWKHLAASSRKDPNITGKDVARFPIAIPPLPEQQRIVSVLSLWDTAIAKQTVLIEQLTLRKRGLMQQLLTGKKRLKGFGGEWEKIKFKEIFQRKTQIVNDSSNVQVLSVTKEGIVSQKEYFNKEVASDDTSKYLLVEKGDLAMSGLNFWMGSCHILTQYEKGIISPAYKVFSIRDGFSIEYIVNFVQSYNFKSSLLGSSVIGASIVRRNLDLEMLEEWTYLLPSLPEQKAISDILTYADKEIEIQKQKLAAMQAQKKGLMQVLLTGKKRINE
jgi:type I restriction enzyme S subunit